MDAGKRSSRSTESSTDGGIRSTRGLTTGGTFTRGGLLTTVVGASTGRGSTRGRGFTRGNAVVVAPKGFGRGGGRGRGQVVVDDFEQATSSNLPLVTSYSVAEYYKNLISTELRQSKDQRSSGADYGDNAIGFVKVKRNGSVCTVKANITPETSISKTPYAVSVDVDEVMKQINNATCTCQASAGSCKHHTALIFWLLRRSDEPSPTQVACYWKKSVLSSVKGLKTKTIDELSGRCTVMEKVNDDILREFIDIGKNTNKDAYVIRYSEENKLKVTLYIDHLVIAFVESYGTGKFNAKNFISFCSEKMTSDRCLKVYNETMEQSSKAEWYYQRFGRITASKLYESSRCSTDDGSLVASILGARKFKGNSATKRGLKLEVEVFNLLKEKYPDIRHCGIVLRSDMPIFGASPDGITDTHVFEIKCPSKEETVANYVRAGVLQNKVYYQMQLQMHMCGKRKGILCVADPKFEENRSFSEYEVVLDNKKLKSVLSKCTSFWNRVIFENLK